MKLNELLTELRKAVNEASNVLQDKNLETLSKYFVQKKISESETVHPIRRLIGFVRLHDLKPGETRKAEFIVNPCDLEIYMEKLGRKIIEPGKYFVYAGRNCLDEAVCAEIEL